MKIIAIFITVTFMMNIYISLQAQEVSAAGYDLGIMIDFKDSVTEKQIDDLVKEYSQYRLRKLKNYNTGYNNLKWFYYTDTFFLNKEFLNDIRDQDIVSTAAFTVTHYEQRAYEVKLQYPNPRLWIYFKEDATLKEINNLLEKYSIFEIKTETSIGNENYHVYLVNFNQMLIDKESFRAMMKNEIIVGGTSYWEDLLPTID